MEKNLFQTHKKTPTNKCFKSVSEDFINDDFQQISLHKLRKQTQREVKLLYTVGFGAFFMHFSLYY